MGKISDKSRISSFLALECLKEIEKRFPSSKKDVQKFSEDDIYYVKDKILKFHQNIEDTRYKGFSFFWESNRIRNAFAHDRGNLRQEEIQNLINQFFSLLPKAKSELEQSIGRSYSTNENLRRFEKFGNEEKYGNALERKQLTQSLEDAMSLVLLDSDESISQFDKFSQSSESPQLDEKVLPPNTFGAKEVHKFLQTKNDYQESLLNFAKNHDKLSEQIQEEVLQNTISALDETDLQNDVNPFFDENNFIQKLKNLSSEKLLSSLQQIQQQLQATKTSKENSCNFDFYENEFEEILLQKSQTENSKRKIINLKKDEDANERQEILSRNLKQDLEKSLLERYTAWQIAEIDKRRKKYLEELYKKIEQFKKLEDRLSPIIKEFGCLWDLSEGDFNDVGFEILKEFQDLLENDEALQELADIVGRQAEEKESYEKELREKTELKTEYHPRPAYRGQISGFRLSGEITSSLPSELALLNNPATKIYFAKKFAEKKLLSYDYIKG